MPAPNFSPALTAIIDREHARAREFLDCLPEMSAMLKTDARPAIFAKMILRDCLQLAADPEQMIYRAVAWEQLVREHGG